MAGALGIKQQQISAWENDGVIPSDKHRAKLARQLQVDLTELLEWIADEHESRAKAAERHAAETQSELDQVLSEMREVIQENRDINDQIGRDVAELRSNFEEISKQLRAVSEALGRVAEVLEAQQTDVQPL